jgi:hypothetical protein
MAKLDFYRQQVIPRIATPNTRGLAAVGTQAAETADAVSKLALLGAKISDNSRATKLVDLNARASAELNEFVLNLERDTDYDTQLDRYKQRVSEIEANVRREVGNDTRLFGMWQREFSVPSQARSFDVQKNALRGTIRRNRATLDDSLYTFSQLTGSGNPEQDAYAMAQGVIAIDDSLARGDITDEEAVNLRQEFVRLSSNNEANRALMTNPEQFEVDVRNGKFTSLTVADRLKFENEAANVVERNARARVAAEEREMREMRDNAQKDMDDAVRLGTLTPAMLRQYRDVLSPDDYRYFSQRISGTGEKVTNNNVYADLLVRASSGQDITPEARRQYTLGNIKENDFERLVSISSGSGWYKRGAQTISGALRVSEINPDPAAAQRQTSAMNDWYDWANSQDPQKVTIEQANSAAQRIVREYAIIDTQNNVLTLRLPTYAVGGRENFDYNATLKATERALREGKISSEEFANQSLLLKKWKAAAESIRNTRPPTTRGER